jgi:adenosylcobinamide-GDP ribazoletransferase
MQINFKNEWNYCLLAFGKLTRLSAANLAQPNDLIHAAKYFPLAGMVVGAVGALGFYLAAFLFPTALAVLMAMASTIYFTNARQESDLARSVNAMSKGLTAEQALTSPQHSQVSGYGAVALWVVLFAKYQALSAMHPAFIPLILISGHALSRFAIVLTMATSDKLNQPANTRIQPSKTDLLIALAIAVLPFLVILRLLISSNHNTLTIANFAAMTLLPMLAIWYFWRDKLQNRLEVSHGSKSMDDGLGAMQQLTELTFYLGALAWSLNLPA